MSLRKLLVFTLLALWQRLPAPTAMAADVYWDDAGGSASKLWSDFGNWNPDGSVENDDVFIGVDTLGANVAAAAGDRTLFDGGIQIGHLRVGNGADVVNSTDEGAANDFELIVNGDTFIDGAGSSIVIYGGDPDGLDTNNLTLGSGAQLILNSTTAQGSAVVEVDGDAGAGLLDVDADGTLIGTGRIDLEASPGSATVLIRNDGEIVANTSPGFIFQAPAAGTLQITATSANALFDWDGTSGNGVLQVNGNQTLDIDVSTGSDGFGGEMNLGTGSTIDVANGWALDSGTINANTPAFGLIIIGQDPNPGPGATIAGAAWTMSGGTINVDDSWDTLILESNLNATGGVLSVAGVLQIDGTAAFAGGADLAPVAGSADFVVNGSATINQASFNWDGFDVTTVNDGALLTINSANIDTAADGYDAVLNINGGTVNVVNLGWSLEIATINLDTSASDSDLSGNTITVNSDSATINVTGSGAASADINATLIIDAALDVNIAAGTTLDLNNNTVNVTGTSWTGGAGSVLRNGAATINAVTTYDLAGGRVDLDDGNDVLNAQLNINADAIDSALDGVDGTLTINNSGSLAVNLTGNAPWSMDGILQYNGDAASGTIVSGNSPVEFQSASTLNVDGEGAIISRATFRGTVNINDAPEDLELFGGDLTPGNTNVLEGATINGPGELAVDDGQALRGHGTINAPFRGDGSAQLIAEGGTLAINGALQSAGRIGTSGASAILDVASAWNTIVADLIVLDDGTIQGATVTNDGNGFRGRGTITARVINNSDIVSTTPGTLVVDNAANDWDGAANTGVLRASQGVLELRDNAAFLFNGTVQADDGTVFANGFELEFDPGSTLILSSGRYRSTHATDLGGTVDVLAGLESALEVNGTVVLENGSATSLNGNLRLQNATTQIDSGATLSGGGTLINSADRLLRLQDGADVDVLIENEGKLAIGAGAAQATGLDFQQDASGAWTVDLEGLALNQFDRLTLTGAASLDGALGIEVGGGYVPALGDAFNILSAVGGVAGAFSGITQPAAMPAGLMFDVIYNPTLVQLQVINSPSFTADFDVDGDVDGDDLAQWQGDFGANSDSDADGDGDSDGADFLAWQQQFGSGVPATAAAAAIPEPSVLGLVLALFTAMPLGRRELSRRVRWKFRIN